MKLSARLSEARVESYPGRTVRTLLDPDGTGTRSFVMGVITYLPGCVVEPHTHDDQEGLYVTRGRGRAKIGDEVVGLEPGVAVYIPKGVVHSVTNEYEDPLEAVLAHAPVCGP